MKRITLAALAAFALTLATPAHARGTGSSGGHSGGHSSAHSSTGHGKRGIHLPRKHPKK